MFPGIVERGEFLFIQLHMVVGLVGDLFRQMSEGWDLLDVVGHFEDIKH